MGIFADFHFLDPTQTSYAADVHVAAALFDSLLALKPDLTVSPALAQSVDTSPDGLTFTFHLRKDVVFHDGEPFNADAVLFNYSRMLNDAQNPRRGDFLPGWALTVVDPSTVRFTLKAPYPGFLTFIAASGQMMMRSPKALQDKGDGFGLAPVGTGPFSFVEWVKDDHLTAKKNPKYWNKDATGIALPYLDEVVFRPVPDDSVKLISLKTGQLDMIDTVPPKDVASLKSTAGITVYEQPTLGFAYMTYNHSRAPFDKLENRLALQWCVERQPLIDAIFFGSGAPAFSPIPPTSWAYDTSFQPFKLDLAKAKQLAPNGFTFTCLTGSPTDAQTAQVLQQQFARAGITMNVSMLDNAAFIAAVTSADGNFQAYMGGQTGGVDPNGTISNNFGSAGTSAKRDRYKNPVVDDLITQAQVEPDQAKRKALYSRINQIAAVDDARMVFLRFTTGVMATSSKVRGFTQLPIGTIVTGSVYLAR